MESKFEEIEVGKKVEKLKKKKKKKNACKERKQTVSQVGREAVALRFSN